MRAVASAVRIAAVILIGAITGIVRTGAPTSASAAGGAYAAQLTRAPYLTDLVGLSVAVNYATDRSSTLAQVQYGPVGADGTCTLSSAIIPNRVGITVGQVPEYQWTAVIALPAVGTYCYRVYLNGMDLLGTNASPQFRTQTQAGDMSPFTFDVFGDWGAVNADGSSPDQAALMSQIAASGAKFALATGDTGYPSGNQSNYGDLQQTGANVSAVFGPQLWTVVGGSIPLFNAAGNHGLSGVTHTDITTWTQAVAVSSSGGRYQNDFYPSMNGTTATNYGSEWYAFTAGNARFYVIETAWGDTNPGTLGVYGADAAAHWAPGSPELTWLTADLASHPTQLKFAVFHYPLYSDSKSQPSDSYLDGPANLEGLLAANGVQLVFNGHAHIYERNLPSAAGMPITYVTGGGGGTLEPVDGCSTFDAYAIGWSPTKSAGSSCRAPRPTSARAVYHFLKVTVSGGQVTVAPTNALGQTFDVQTYQFAVRPQVFIDSAPAGVTNSTTATVAFHATDPGATFQCTLDGAASAPCASPATFTGLGGGVHTVAVTATVVGAAPSDPATASWAIDASPPSTPAGLQAVPVSPFQVNLSWSPSTDDTGVAAYAISRDGAPLRTVGGTTTTLTDTVAAGSTHTYSVVAVDGAGNSSPPSPAVTATTPSVAPPVFADGFESGKLSAWTSTQGLTVQTQTVRTGQYAALAATTNGNTYAKASLSATYADGYLRAAVNVVSQSTQVNLLRVRSATGASLAYVYVTASGVLGIHDDTTGANLPSTTTLSPGWHVLELHLGIDSAPATASGTLELWADGPGSPVISTASVDTGSAPIGQIQIGDVQTARTYTVAYDDVAFGTSRLGPNP